MGRLRLQTYLTWACRQIGGNVSVIAALSAVPVILAVTGVLEITDMTSARSGLQAAADAGSLAGAGQLAVATVGSTQVIQTAITVAQQSIETSGTGGKTTTPSVYTQ